MKRAATPPDISVNHGTPNNPTATYMIWLIPPQYLPSSMPAIKTAKVCPVTGTGVHGKGMTI